MGAITAIPSQFSRVDGGCVITNTTKACVVSLNVFRFNYCTETVLVRFNASVHASPVAVAGSGPCPSGNPCRDQLPGSSLRECFSDNTCTSQLTTANTLTYQLPGNFSEPSSCAVRFDVSLDVPTLAWCTAALLLACACLVGALWHCRQTCRLYSRHAGWYYPHENSRRFAPLPRWHQLPGHPADGLPVGAGGVDHQLPDDSDSESDSGCW
jgi:hypothetical protein